MRPMPTRTTPRRGTAPTHGTGRFARPMSAQRHAPRGRRPMPGRGKQHKSGGMLASIKRALPEAMVRRLRR